VFRVNTDGTGFTDLHSFTQNNFTTGANSDGANPRGGLVLAGTTLYGTAEGGGSAGYGTVFKLNSDGTGFTTLHSFSALKINTNSVNTNSDGATPGTGLVLSDNTLYGTAAWGGFYGSGTIFALNTNGTGFTVLHSFRDSRGGTYALGGLVLSGNVLYGTGGGTIFKINVDGTGYATLYSFTAGEGDYLQARLVQSGNTLYGTTPNDGIFRGGTVFAVGTDGADFTILHSFTAIPADRPYTNSDGNIPRGGLFLSDNTLYGATQWGGSSGEGTVFAINTDGSGFINLYSFTATNPSTNSDGASPQGGLTLSGNTLYGTAGSGGISGNGTVFSLSLGPFSPPQLTILVLGSNVILTWPTNATGFTLQSATNLAPPGVWTTVSPAPVVIDSQNAVTNPISGTQQFFRLSQ
jgi:uncharacterized repeat protein (TIGR03803 family)